MQKKVVLIFALCILPLWWVFHVLWQPFVIHLIADVTYSLVQETTDVETKHIAIDRALLYSTRGWNGGEDVLFTPDELSHLNDVSKLYKSFSFTINTLATLSWAVLIFALSEKIDILPYLNRASHILIGTFLFKIIGLVFFSVFFDNFHQVLFPQGNYSFPAESVLITIFPEIFWKVVMASLMLMLFIWGLVYKFLGRDAIEKKH